jgi:transposase
MEPAGAVFGLEPFLSPVILPAFLPGVTMSNRRFEMFHYRQVLVRMRQGDSDRDLARARLMGRRKAGQLRELATQQGWLTPGTALPEDTQLAAVLATGTALPVSCVSTLKPWREEIAAWVDAGITGVRIHQALKERHGYAGSYASVYRMLRALQATRAPTVPMRLVFKPAEAAQVDFGSGPTITDVTTGEMMKTWFFVMTLCHSRHQYVEFVRDQTVATWLGCHRRAFEWFNGVPGRLIIDNPKCAIVRACLYEPEVQRAYAECAQGYGFKIDPCPPRDPQKKGIVESGVKYVKRGFLPLRAFRSLDDANRQVCAWVMAEAGNRVHGTTRRAPLSIFAEVERALLTPLPDVPPELAVWARVKVHRDAHVQFSRSFYSVPFRLAGQSLWLKATGDMVWLYREHELIATHPRHTRPGSRATATDHLPPEALAWNLQDIQWCLKQAEQVGPACLALVRALFGDRVLIKLRAVQGVLRLAKTCGASRLEAACARANRFGTQSLRAVTAILQKGLDQQPAAPALDPLAATYTEGGRFCRDTQTLLTP